ncbi:MAG: tRNA (guanosine(46)-N7)-methyltransferase TrmB [Myxococcales bacterium]|nr:tRNA (guanosine(46)-N7)-methyltransferase TrmB [Myxococcales bacterium]MDH3484585.1 tRNA (guanosine(46)-N7)-methyltransferase TrmB [Myxococcales bacterium]
MSDSRLRRLYVEHAPKAPEGRFSLGALAGGKGPLELDIGFGRGQSLLERAEAAPGSRIIGIEVKTKWAYKVQQRLTKHGVSNVQVVCGDAREILRRAGPEGVVDKVALHFPDPWWKKRHQKRRVVGEPLLVELRRLMRAEGELLIQTDVEDRARLYLRQLLAIGGFRVVGDGGFVDENPFSARSNRERRALEAGLPIWRILAIRDAG